MLYAAVHPKYIGYEVLCATVNRRYTGYGSAARCCTSHGTLASGSSVSYRFLRNHFHDLRTGSHTLGLGISSDG